jgi:hypothetical protein
MKVNIMKSIIVQVEGRDAELFETMLKLALIGFDKIKLDSENSTFVLVGTEPATYDEIKTFTEDMVRLCQ